MHGGLELLYGFLILLVFEEDAALVDPCVRIVGSGLLHKVPGEPAVVLFVLDECLEVETLGLVVRVVDVLHDLESVIVVAGFEETLGILESVLVVFRVVLAQELVAL